MRVAALRNRLFDERRQKDNGELQTLTGVNGHYFHSNFIAFNAALKLFISTVGVVDEFGERFEALACTCTAGKAWNGCKYFCQVVEVGDVSFTIFFAKNAL